MQTPSKADANPRSPKRQALTPSAARAVAALDDAIWMSIIDFLPAPKQLTKSETQSEWYTCVTQDEAAVAEVTATYKTLLNLRLVTKELAALLHPVENVSLWRKLVLQSFDFSAGDYFNVENHHDEHDMIDPDDQDGEDGDDGDDAMVQCHEDQGEDAETETEGPVVPTGPQRVAMRGRYDRMPRNYLEENLVEWPKLGISHRRRQYSFLTALQKKRRGASWPEAEDPFTLFGDLVRLLQMPDSESMETGGEGSSSPFKYLAAPAEADSSSAFYRFYVMKTLGYAPHFWHRGSGIGDEWKGFTETEAYEAKFDENPDDYDNDSELGFPLRTGSEAKRLFWHIRQHCQDWRSVCCNNGWDGETPVFFVGQSKAAPHRWFGYAGEKTWT